MAGWKKVLLEGDASELSDATPEAVGTAGGAGTGSAASREDHVHALGAGVVDDATIELSLGVLGVKEDGIGATEIDDAATDIAFAQIILTPAADGVGTVEGTLFFDSDDKHPYVYQA